MRRPWKLSDDEVREWLGVIPKMEAGDIIRVCGKFPRPLDPRLEDALIRRLKDEERKLRLSGFVKSLAVDALRSVLGV